MSYVWTRFVVPLIRTCRTPPPLGVGSVNSDAMQTLDIEDMDEPKKMITDKQQIMWDLAFEHGRVAKISSDGEYLADKMREKGLILEDVGNACGVSKSCVGNWVQDLRPIPRKHKETIATTFGILL